MSSRNTLIVIPAFNEEKSIGKVLKKINKKFDVLVVDDGSSDRTDLISINLGAKILRITNNLGVDNAINQGFKFAKKNKYNFVITIDADGQHDPSYLDEIYKLLKYDNFKLVIGERVIFPRFSEYLFSNFTKKSVNVKDLLTGLKGYNIELYNVHGCYDSFRSIGTELSFFSILRGYNYKILKIRIFKRKDKSRLGGWFGSNLKILRSLLFLMHRYIYFKYAK
jgi:glycosyltransferase involved in cell wall biosynthesis